MADPLIELMGKILTHIPDDADVTLAILKGHLIIEEELNKALEAKVKSAADIEDARLSFKQLMLITKSHYIADENSWCWGALNNLNKIRNSLSHKLEPEDLNKNLAELVDLVEQYQRNGEVKEFNERLRHALAMLAANIHGLWRSSNA